MPISDHYRGGMTERLSVKIITVDVANGRVEAVGKDAAVIQIGVSQVPPLFCWPVENERWTIIRENGQWQLESKLPDSESLDISTLNPGDAIVQAKTIWTPDGERLIKTGDSAGGVLSGTYPSPGFAVDMATQTELNSINTSLDGRVTSLESAPGRIISVQTLAGAVDGYTTLPAASGNFLRDATNPLRLT